MEGAGEGGERGVAAEVAEEGLPGLVLQPGDLDRASEGGRGVAEYGLGGHDSRRYHFVI